MAFAVDAVAEGDDKYLGRWIKQCLDSTIGPRPFATHGVTAPGVAGPYNIHQVTVIMATKVGKGVTLGLRALAPLRSDPSAQGGTANVDTKGYTKDDIPSLMGFSDVKNGHNLQHLLWEKHNAYWRHIIA